jgi:threonine aldolase
VDFTSDNVSGVAPAILEALAAASRGDAPAYGEDPLSERLTRRFSEVFAHEVAVFPVVTGTAANCLAFAALVPPHGAIICHESAHIEVDECGAPEFFTHGAKLIRIGGEGGKLTPAALAAALARFRPGDVHQVQPAVVSITQASEAGTVYRPDEISALARLAHDRSMKLHMDGARFANAVAFLGCSPAELTWRAGVDVLSFGATKGGALAAEAVVFFDPGMAGDFVYRRKKAGHLLSKMRFISAQLEAYLTDDLWLTLAARANALARKLAEGLSRLPGAALVHPVEANEVFVRLPDAVVAHMRDTGAKFYDWEPSANGKTMIRLVTSFATEEKNVERLLAAAGRKP